MEIKLVLVVILVAAFAKGQDESIQFPSKPQPQFPIFPEQSTSSPMNSEESSSLAPITVLNPLSLLPLPNGPYYGFPFDTRQALGRYLPLTVAGTCEERTIFNITRARDLLNYRTELECIFNLGRAPDKVPTGAYYVKPLTSFNTQLFNTFTSVLLSGFLVNEAECNGQLTHIGWINFVGRPLFPFRAGIGTLNLNLAPGEYRDGRSNLILDWSEDLTRSCSDYRSNLQKYYTSAVVRRRNLITQNFPMNQFVSTLRFIGKQEDGGAIYLGKTYMKDPFRPDNQAVTVGFYYMVNYEENVMKGFNVGDVLPPLRKTFKYMFPGIHDLPFRLSPMDNLITTPVRTVSKVVRGAFNVGKNSLMHANELVRGFSTFGTNTRRFQEAFKNDRISKGIHQNEAATPRPNRFRLLWNRG